MSTNFSASLDSFIDKTDNVTEILAAHINDLQDGMEAVQAKIGADNSTVATSLDYKVGGITEFGRTLIDDTTATAGRSTLEAGKSGSNSDITSLNGLATPLSISLGGSGTTGDSVVKGWIKFDGTGTVSIQDSYNVTSITDNGTGNYTVTWDTVFSNASYCCVSGGDQYQHRTSPYTATDVSVRCYDNANNLTDDNKVTVIAIGD